MRMLVWVPSMVVVRVGSELIMSPFRLQVILRGLSPFDTTQVNCANSPWLTTSSPNEKGMIFGFSANKISQCLHLITINSEFSWVSGHPCSILSSTGVDSTMVVVHCSDDQHTGLGAQHSSGQGGVRVDNVSLQTPGYWQGLVSSCYDTC